MNFKLIVDSSLYQCSLRKQTTFGDATTGFPAKWHLRNERRNSILMTRQHPHLGSASDWSCRVGNSTNQKHYPELGSDASSLWNFWARFSDVICVGKPVVAPPNVGCFLRLIILLLLYLCMPVKRGKEGSSDSHIKRTRIFVRKLEVGPPKLSSILAKLRLYWTPKGVHQ